MRLLVAAANPDRGWEALVIGEPHRAFYGDQFQNTFPTLHHHGIELWVPEVGGRVDPESEAHDLLMVLFGGMSKGERNRIKLRVRAAMADLTEREGRYLGGRPTAIVWSTSARIPTLRRPRWECSCGSSTSTR